MYWTIDGEVYDLTPLYDPQHKDYFAHPGGLTILKEARGTDATFLFHSYHWRGLPNIEKYKVSGVAPTLTPFSRDMKQDLFYTEVKETVRLFLRNRDTRLGKAIWFLPALFTVYLIFEMFNGNYLALFLSPFLYWVVLANTYHDLEHHGWNPHPVFKFLNEVFCAWFLDPPTWRAQHHYSHHVYTNILEYDADLAHNYLTHRSIPRANAKNHFRYSFLLYLPLMSLLVFPIRLLHTLKLVVGKLAKNFDRTYPVPYLEISFFVGVKLVWFYFMCVRPFYIFTFWKAFLFATWFSVCLSLQFMMTSQVNHLLDITTRGLSENQFIHNSWTKHQVVTSSNWSQFKTQYNWASVGDCLHWAKTWFFYIWGGALNYQIEHHLFPSMPSILLKEIAPIVRELCKKHQVDYPDCGDYSKVLCDHLLHLQNLNFYAAVTAMA